MELHSPALVMTDRNRDITATVRRERARLANFIRRRVGDPTEAEDILQDVFSAFVEAYRLPAPIEQASAWLFQVARYRIVDRFRKKKERPLGDADADSAAEVDDNADDLRLDLALPSPEAGPEAAYARSVLLGALQQALDELPAPQRDVFVAHELDGLSFKEIAASTGVGINTLLGRKRYAVLALRASLGPLYEDLDS